jgi:hypothetical protein
MLFVLGLVVLVLDFAAGSIYQAVAGHSFFERPAVRAIEAYHAEQELYRVESPIYDHDLRPMVSLDDLAWGSVTYDLRTNSLGFKDGEARQVPLETDVPRVLFIGDSFTEGVGYGYEQTFVGIVDSALAPSGVEVLNAGVSSYSPLIYWRKLQYWIGRRGLDVDEVVVYLDISDASNEAETYSVEADGRIAHTDEWDAGEQQIVRPPGSGRLGWLKDLVKHNTVVMAMLTQVKVALFPRETGPNYPLDNHLSRWTIDDSTWQAYGEEGVRRMQVYMDSLHTFLRERDIPLTVAVYPWPDQVMAGDLDSRQVRIWRQWAAERSVRFVNHFPDLVVGDTPEDRMATLVRYYIDGDFHWNEAGHRLIARRFLRGYQPPVAEEGD